MVTSAWIVAFALCVQDANGPTEAEQKLAEARVKQASAHIVQLETAVEMYWLMNGRYPDPEAGLATLVEGRQLADLPTDPWGRDYVFEVPGPDGAPYMIVTRGADGKEGGEGENADIANVPLDDDED